VGRGQSPPFMYTLLINFMNITNKTTLQRNLDALERRATKTIQALQHTANALNAAYDSIWSLPEDQLLECLQTLVDTNKFEEIFGVHLAAATGINSLLDAVEASGARAKVGVGRPYLITDGVVSFPTPEPLPEGYDVVFAEDGSAEITYTPPVVEEVEEVVEDIPFVDEEEI